MIPTRSPRFGAVLSLLLGLAATPVASAQNTPARPRPYALRDVRLSDAEDAPRKTILLRDGRIEGIQDLSVSVPADVWVIEADGLVAMPGLLDAWSATGCATTPPTADKDQPVEVDANVRIDMRQANRKGVQPAFRSADVLALDEELADRHRQSGFGVLLSAPSGELLSGSSTLATVRDAASRDLIVKEQVFQNAAFRASGGGYPGTLMAYHAQLRQFFLDADQQRRLRARFDAGKAGPRPAFDDDLRAALGLLEGDELLVCEAETSRDIERWIRLADEFGIQVAIAGGRDAWRVADTLARRDIPVFMTLDWGDEPDDPDAEDEKDEPEETDDPEGEKPAEEGADAEGEEEGEVADHDEDEGDEGDEEEDSDGLDYTYHEPIGIQREKRRLWEERRNSAIMLREAGVRVVFCSGDGKPADLLKNVRALVEEGFPRDAALQALSSQPAELVGADRHFGWLRAGHSANLCLWTDHPLTDDAQVAWSIVDGFPKKFEVKEKKGTGEGPDEGVDLSGRWSVTFPDDDEAPEMVLTLKMAEDGKVTGSVKAQNPMDESDLFADVAGEVSGDEFSLHMTFSVGGFGVEIEMDGDWKRGELKGKSTIKMPGNEEQNSFEATRLPDDGGLR